jgi:tetratricopeptide (TPR) repeat protein
MLRVGRPDDAERYLRLGVEGLDRLGETGFNSTMTALLAGALCDLERWEEAEAFVDRSREMGSPDDFATQAQWRMALARIRVAQGRLDEALDLVEAALGIVEPTDYLTMQAEAHEIRAEVLEALERTDDARVAFAQALRAQERKGSVPAIERIRGRLASLLG